jgi:hypothetical protein
MLNLLVSWPVRAGFAAGSWLSDHERVRVVDVWSPMPDAAD